MFNDFSEWVEETLNFLINRNLSIGVKPHPMSRYSSLIYEEKLKNKYKDKIIWLNPGENNYNLIDQNIKFIVSPSGSLTYACSLLKKIVINCGRNPYMSFNYSYTPKSKKEYFKLLKKGINNKLKITKNYKFKVLASVYMFFLHQFDYFKTVSREIDLFQFYNFEKPSNILNKIIKYKNI